MENFVMKCQDVIDIHHLHISWTSENRWVVMLKLCNLTIVEVKFYFAWKRKWKHWINV